MARAIGGRIIVSGLCVTLCAKAALSLPPLPFFQPRDVPSFQDLTQIQVAAEKKGSSIEAAKDPPPLVENLPEKVSGVQAPEELLRSLARERELLEVQKRDLAEQKAELALAQERLAIEKRSLVELKDSIEELLASVDSFQTDDLNRLIDFYKNMKPAHAARIMDDMDIETTIMIMGTMNPRLAAPILAQISPVRARAISKIILERSQLPGDQDLTGIKLR